ncbi:MAG: hypothetical protein ACM3X0_11350 [Bacteroidota bacterium]
MSVVSHARLRVRYTSDALKSLDDLAGCLNQAAFEQEALLHCVALGYCIPGESMHTLFVREVHGDLEGIEASIYSKTSGANYRIEAKHGTLPHALIQSYPGWVPTSYTIHPS